MEAAQHAGISIRSECGGKGVCGKCAVIIRDQTSLSELTAAEKRLLSEREIRVGYRLACQAIARGDTVVEVLEETRLRVRRFQMAGIERRVKLSPLVSKHHIILHKPTIMDVRPDAERLLDFLSATLSLKGLKIDYDVLRALPDVLRDAEWDVTATVWNNKIIAVEGGDTTDILHGLAVDIGTSKVAVSLIDLTTGETLGSGSIENPQLVHGEDLISRITYVIEGGAKNLEELQGLAVRGTNIALVEVCERNNVDPNDIHEITIVGNTAMLHLFLAIQPKHLTLSPYTPAIKQPLNIKARELRMGINPNGNVHILPVVAGFVGADAVADALATGIYDSKDMSLLMDVGTNGEVLLGNSDNLISCSCAAGPAWEGGHIRYGMRAYTGAIEKIRIDPETHEVEYETVGGEKPVGLCGSAIVDVVAEMFKSGIIDFRGSANNRIQSPRLRRVDGEREFVIAWKEETGIKRDIVVTWGDIGEIILAKAAMRTGCEVLMKRMGLTEKDLDRVYIAGAFGNYINPENAKVLGLIPDIPVEKIRLVGNTALSGAKMALISKEARETAVRLSKKIRYVELIVAPEFETEFVNSLYIPYGKP